MRLIDADELITAFPCGESVRTESVRATINHMPTIEVSEDAISREGLLNTINAYMTGSQQVEHMKSIIKDAPSVIPKEKEGEWKSKKASIYPYGYDVECSVCGHRMGSSFGYKFCPNCGAKMKGASDD